MSEDHMDRDGTDVKIVLREEAPDQHFGRPSNKFTCTIDEARRLMKDIEAAISAQNRVAAHGRGSARQIQDVDELKPDWGFASGVNEKSFARKRLGRNLRRR
jgi:hypothetical protein